MADKYKLVNAAGSGGSGDAETFTTSFNGTTSWGAPSGGFYSFVVPQSTHQKNLNPLVQVYADIGGGDFEQVETEVQISTAGDVTLLVTETIDARFAGKVVIL